jgi:4-amino-4-deoxy-L-arabinose transferase-like glycosyltransferase
MGRENTDDGGVFPDGPDAWYYWPSWEAEIFGQQFLYDGMNNPERLLLAGRLMQMILTLLTGLVIFLWAKQLAGTGAGFLGTALWVFNPIALAYGRVIQTDAGIALMFLLALWAFTCFLHEPSARTAAVGGLALGGALCTKLSAVLLGPIFLILSVVFLWTGANRAKWLRQLLRPLPVYALSTWAVILLVYAPHWTPAPPFPPEQAAKLGVPSWFQFLRPVLIPADFFKALAILKAQSVGYHHAGYLWGEWSMTGWWYYFPVAIVLKTPIPLLLLMTGGLVCLLRQWRHVKFDEMVPWIAAAVYLGFAMTSSMNLGIRHLLPMFPLLTIGAATQLWPRGRALRLGAILLCGWLAVVAVRAHPFYIQYFNEFAGGPANGYKYLVDSNLDWGQDVKRLKRYVEEHAIEHFYLHSFGIPSAFVYYGIPHTYVTAQQAKDIEAGALVVSASRLMRPEWDWLREKYKPIAQVAYTFFVYKRGND